LSWEDFIYLTPLEFYNPPPLFPSLGKGGGRFFKREASPLLDSPFFSDEVSQEGGVYRRGAAPLLDAPLGLLGFAYIKRPAYSIGYFYGEGKVFRGWGIKMRIRPPMMWGRVGGKR
jgi:hypothetical protein